MKVRKDYRILFGMLIIALLIAISIIPISMGDFVLPSQGGGMVHQDLEMSENIRLPCPNGSVGELWYRDDIGGLGTGILPGGLRGTVGNSIAGNGNIAACSFGPFYAYGCALRPNDKLVIYDYFGNQIWTSGWWRTETKNGREHNYSLNPSACASTPMVDEDDRVIACDANKIILINASDHSNVEVDWVTELPGFIYTFNGIPFSPSIVENESIILPTMNGPVYLIDVDTGDILATMKLGNNASLLNVWGVPELNVTEWINIYKDYALGKCPFYYNETSGDIEWNSTITCGIFPTDKNIFIDNDLLFCTWQNNVTVYEKQGNNWTEITSNEIATPTQQSGEGFYSTINSATVDGNRVFILGECRKNNRVFFNNTNGKLFAIDVFPNATLPEDRLVEAWNYSYFGRSQATPTLINGSLYFDGYNNTVLAKDFDPHIYAVNANDGTEKWKMGVDGITTFTMTTDPRGGIWYEDADQFPWRLFDGSNKLFRYNETNGSTMDAIDMKTILNDPEHPHWRVFPCSNMLICDDVDYPIMLVSANHKNFKEGKWVLAINLTANETIWNVTIDHNTNYNFAGGAMTILRKYNQSRVLFPTFGGGMMCIGEYPNASLEITGYQFKDSPFDTNSYNDRVQVNYSITTVIPDKVRIKAMLVSEDHKILGKFESEATHEVTTPYVNSSINVTLKHYAPEGQYKLYVFLFNSSGDIMESVNNPFNSLIGNMEYANATYYPNQTFYMYPPTDPPATPSAPVGTSSVLNDKSRYYTTSTTDPNGDSIYYQWQYNTSIGFNYITRWVTGGPYSSGANASRLIGWLLPGTYQIKVRAKDDILQPNVFTNWSNTTSVTVNQNYGAPAPFNNPLINQFSQTLMAPAQQTSSTGFTESVADMRQMDSEPLNWTWDFGDGNISYGQNVSHNYSQTGNYIINLTIRHSETSFYNTTLNVSVIVIKSDFSYTNGQPDINVTFTDTSTGVYSIDNWTWNFGDGNFSYQQNPKHIYSDTGIYNVSLKVNDTQNNTHTSYQLVYIEANKPQFVSVIDYPDPVGIGQNLTVGVNLFENQSGIDGVYINVTKPDSNYTGSLNMEANVSYPYDYIYVYTDTWQYGVYNYSITVVDVANNTNITSGFNFTVSAQATMTVCTIKDSYLSNQDINITDPPGERSLVGYEYLDNGEVIHIWNDLDDYFINASSGIQITNHKDEYWSQNVLMLGYYNNDQWNLMYRTDQLSGFVKDFDSDNETYVNLTVWKVMSYAGRPFILAIRYYLELNDNELTVIPYIKNLGTYNPYDLAFGWELKDIQIDMTTTGDYIAVNNTQYYLNNTLDESYTNLSHACYTILEDITADFSKSLYLRWNNNLQYKLMVKSRDGQTNAPVTLFIKVGTLAAGQEKFTKMYWYDASQQTYYFDQHDETEIWSESPENMVDNEQDNYALTACANEVQLCNSLSIGGEPVGSILKVELRAYAYSSSEEESLYLRPVFSGEIDGSNYTVSLPTEGAWSSYYNITDDSNAPSTWSWTDVENLDCDVEALSTSEHFCSKVEVRVTYNGNPTSGTPYPTNSAIGVELTPMLNITVSDPDGDLLNISWLSNSSGSWQHFGTNNSCSNGTYHQIFSNATENGKWWYWRVNTTDNTTYVVGPTYKFYTGYQSKIKNTGSTNISGYLLIQVRYYNTGKSSWDVALTPVNETTPRTINAGDQFGLDTVFNGLVNSNNLSSFGNGTYKIYAAFRDNDGNVIDVNDTTKLEATYEFTITYS